MGRRAAACARRRARMPGLPRDRRQRRDARRARAGLKNYSGRVRIEPPAGDIEAAHERDPVEAARVLEEVTRPGEARGDQVPAVVVRLRVRDDEERPRRGADVVRHVVPGAVRIVEEAALLDEQLPRVWARPGPAVPAEWALTEHPLEGVDRPKELLALLLAGESPRLDPAPAVAEEVVVVRAHPVG